VTKHVIASLDHLCGILRERVIFMLDVTFYGDESGIHDPHGKEPGSEVAAIGGYIATKRQWKRFEQRWKTALREYKVPEFHMSQYNRQRPKPESPYFGWSQTKKKTFLRLLIKIARDNTTAAYASTVQTQAWDKILDDETKLGSPQDDSQKNPWHTCFQNFFAQFPYFLKKMVDPLLSKHTPPEKIAFIFDHHETFGPAAQIGYGVVKKVLPDGGRFGGISFLAAKECPPIQAADLFTFYVRRRFTRSLKNIAIDEFEEAILGNDENVWLVELTPEKLKELRENNERVRRARGL
jgi:hypothetical protein